MISTRSALTACFLSFLFNGAVSLAVANDTLTPRSLHTSKQGNQYAGGSSVVIEKKVAGDLIAAGGSISVTQAVAKDAVLAGGTIAVYAPVAEDLRAFGGDLSFGNEIGGELVAAGGKILLSERGHVSGSANLSGGQINILERKYTAASSRRHLQTNGKCPNPGSCSLWRCLSFCSDSG